MAVAERLLRDLFMKFSLLRKLPPRLILIIAAIVVLLSFTTAGLLTITQTISSSGTITALNVGVYSDSACTQSLTSISWGQIAPGDSVPKTIYIKNTGNAPITLSMSTDSWGPSGANGPITITWDKSGASLNVGQSTSAVLTLAVSSSISGITSFSVNIEIIGSG
jgi:hypothetical protein